MKRQKGRKKKSRMSVLAMNYISLFVMSGVKALLFPHIKSFFANLRHLLKAIHHVCYMPKRQTFYRCFIDLWKAVISPASMVTPPFKPVLFQGAV